MENSGFEKSSGRSTDFNIAKNNEEVIIEESESKGFQNCGRLFRSSVHEHFEKIQVSHPSSKKTVDGSNCKYCGTTLINRVSTNLKNHLKFKHPEVFDEVKRKNTLHI